MIKALIAKRNNFFRGGCKNFGKVESLIFFLGGEGWRFGKHFFLQSALDDQFLHTKEILNVKCEILLSYTIFFALKSKNTNKKILCVTAVRKQC